MSTTSSAKTAPSGRSFPSRISAEVAGVTWSWSKVPVRRSFTIETAVMIVVRKESTKPKVPATMKGLPSRRGLKSARVTTSTPPGGAAVGGARLAPLRARRLRMNASALPAGGAGRVGAWVEGVARRQVGDQAAAGCRPARVVHAEREVLHVGREHEPEEDESDERHGDEDGHREGVAQRGAHLAQEERAEPPPAHRAAPASASTRRKTSVIAGCSIETRASGWAATRRASAPRTRASSGPPASATPASVGVAPPPSSAAAAARASGGTATSTR